MDATFIALGQLLVQALPTFFIVLLLFFYLKQVFFGPLERVLHERHEATEGARTLAAAALDRANAKAADYEAQIRAARNEIYKEQDEQRRKWREEQTAQIVDSRKRAETVVAETKAELASQAEQAKEAIGSETQALADRITAAILQGRAA
ncbi:MAG: hypothetical protein H7Y20_17270 [Bryobacteraceae bacterium]|nr:hypothetical protein [Bryobacteraceae bacterium]